ncbi:MAG: heparinase II/III family protein [Pirellulales bacterium]|nr:heparinase II/III family protein [Pirellulales bacterium]
MKSFPSLLVILLVGLLIVFDRPQQAGAQDFPRIEPPAKFPPHPRLFLNQKEIKQLKAWIRRDARLRKYVRSFVAEMSRAAANPQLPDADRNRNKGLARQANKFALAYALTGDAQLARAAGSILKGFIRVIPGYEVSNYKGKATSDTLEEVQWAAYACAAYDLIYNSGVLTKADKDAIENQVFKPSGEALIACNHAHRSNWRIAGTSGAGVIGFCIGDRDLIDRSLNGQRDDARRLVRGGFVSQMAWSMLADGIYYERAAGYTHIILLFYSWMLEAARHSDMDLWHMEFGGSELDLGRDFDQQFERKGKKVFKSYFDAMCYRAFGDGSLAKVGNDGDGRLKREHYWAAAWRAYRDPKYATVFQQGLNDAPVGDPLELMFVSPRMPRGKFDLSADAQIGLTGQHTNACTLLPNGGFAILRNNGKKDAVAVAVTFGEYANAHSHPDLLSISLYAAGHIIAPDMKDYGSGHEGHLGWAKQTIAHNTVTVDEVSQHPQGTHQDAWVGASVQQPAFGRLVLFEPGKRLKAFRAKTDTAYEGVTLDRTIALVDSVVVDFFRCRSANQHQYDLALHVDGTPIKSDVKFAPFKAERLSEQLGYRFLTDLRQASTASDPVELTYRFPASGPTMRVRLLPSTPAELISAKGYPNQAGHRRNVLITRRNGTNVDFVTVMSVDGVAKVRSVQRLTDLPPGLLGVRINRSRDGTVLVISAEQPGTYTVAGRTFTGQIALIRPSR